MLKRRRCSLCGGKLSGNICTECGLDNSKSDDNYVFTPDSRHNGELTHSHGNQAEPLAGKTLTRQQQENAREQMKQQKEAWNQRKLQERQQKKWQKEQQRANAAAGNSTVRANGWNTEKKKRNVGKIISIIAVLVVVFAKLGSAVFDTVSDWSQDETQSYESWYEDDTYTHAYTDEYDMYADTQDTLEDTGDYWEEALEPGLYMGGVHVPAGEYTVLLERGEGELSLEDGRNGIYAGWYFSPDGEEGDVTRVEEIQIFKGARLDVTGDMTLRFQTENAQGELKQLPNPNSESFTFEGEFLVGSDLPAGVYDVYCDQGFGIFEYYVPVNGYESYEGQLIGDVASSFPREMKNIVLPEGVTVTIENMTVTLTPSEYIGSEDYGAYYTD